MRFAQRPYLTLTIIGLAVHLAVVAVFQVRLGGLDAYAFRSPDAREYHALARNLVASGIFSQDSTTPFHPDTWRTPGYPLFLAMLIVFFGDAPTTLIMAQHILAIGCVLVFYAVSRQFLGPGRALVISILFLLEPYHLLYSGWLLSTTLQTLVILLAWASWNAGMQTRATGWFLILGGLLGALILIWPGYAILALTAFPLLWIVRWRLHRQLWLVPGSARISAAAPLALLLAALVVIAPWLERNRQLGGRPALSSQSGIVLAYFKAAEVVLWRQGGSKDRYLALSTDPAHANFPHATWEAIDRELRLQMSDMSESARMDIHWSQIAQGNRTPVNSFRLSQELAAIGVRHLLASPVATISCYAVRIADQLTFPLSLAVSPPAGTGANRVKSAAISAPYVALCVMLLFQLLRGRMAWMDAAFPITVIATSLLVAAPQIDPRFRVPLIPFLLFAALFSKRDLPYPDIAPKTGGP